MYRCDRSETQSDGGICFYADWIGGPTLAKIRNCQIENLAGDMRRTATVTGPADTFFSIPAFVTIQGCRVRGYLTGAEDDSGNLVFHHVYY